MDIRYSTGKEPFKRMTTEEIRKEFLVKDIFIKNDVSAVYSPHRPHRDAGRDAG